MGFTIEEVLQVLRKKYLEISSCNDFTMEKS